MTLELPKTFWEVHDGLPREGPGDNHSTRKAYQMPKNLSPNPRILDVGCGPGMQTVELAKLSYGHIDAVDFYQPFLDQLIESAKKADVSDRVHAIKGDMFHLDYEKQSFDVIWCEGAIFVIGFERGLREWRSLLKIDGYLVVSELSWLTSNRPEEIQSYMKEMYPDSKTVDENIEIAQKCGYQVLGSFVIPKESWLDNYYLPIEAKLPSLKAKHSGDQEAMTYLASEEKEIAMFRKYSDYYGYVFFVLQKLSP